MSSGAVENTQQSGAEGTPQPEAPPAQPAPPPVRTGLWAHPLLSTPRRDALAGTIVFLVALPLCLGIAVASQAPPLAGIVAGVVGGLVVPLISRSPLSVSGPAAGLTAILIAGGHELGSFPALCTAIVIAGVLQIGFGVARAGNLASIVPASVIRGMLSAIGVVIFTKQLAKAVGAPDEYLSIDYLLLSADRFEHWGRVTTSLHLGALLIGAMSLAILVVWPRPQLASLTKHLPWLPPGFIVVVMGILTAAVFHWTDSSLDIPRTAVVVDPRLGPLHVSYLVQLPGLELHAPDWGALRKSATWTIGMTLALVASIETLLSVEAVDRIDPDRRRTPKNRELVAQGVGNLVSGLLGGLPITAVIVRSSANLQAGARDRLSAIVHGVLLLVSVVVLAPLLNHLPVAALAAMLLHVGWRLAAPRGLKQMIAAGYETWVPFFVTLAGVVATDLLRGVMLGFLVSILVILKHATRDTVAVKREGGVVHVDFLRDGTFLVKPMLLAILDDVKPGERVVIDCTNEYIDPDVQETLSSFIESARAQNIQVDVVGIELSMLRLGAH